MGIQINGQTDTISAIDGALIVSGADLPTVTNLNATGIVTATSFSGPLTGNVTGNLTGTASTATAAATSYGLSGNPNISVSTIGVNGASPQTPIDAISNSSGNGITVRGRSADGLGNIRFTSNNYATLYGGFKHDASTLTIFNELSGSLKLGTNGIDRVTIDSSGRLTNPYQPAFFAYRNGAAFTATGPGIFDATRVNTGTHYNTSNGRFTAPVSGVYFFTCQGLPNSASGQIYMYLQKNGTRYSANFYVINPDESCSISAVIDLAISDYVEVYYAGGSEQTYCHFSGFLIG